MKGALKEGKSDVGIQCDLTRIYSSEGSWL